MVSIQPEKFKLLLVDDEPTVLGLLEAELQACGYRTCAANSGEEGIAVARRERPDLILLDVIMAGIDGIETCRRLKADPALHEIPVIFLSAAAGGDPRIQGFEAGGADFVTKPVEGRELLLRIQLHLERQALQHQLQEQNRLLQAEVERRRAAESLHARSEERFRTLFDHASICIGLLDTRGHYLLVNERCAEMFGYSVQEFVGKHCLELNHPDYHQMSREAMARLMEGKEARCDSDRRFLHKDGSEFWGSHSVSALHESNGDCSGFVCVIADLTERKRTEEQLRKLSRALEQSLDMVMVTDLDGRIEFVNPAFERSTGYTRQALMGQQVKFLKRGDSASRATVEMWDRLNRGEAWSGEFANKRRDGTPYWELTTVSPVKDDSGKITNYVVVKEDITARKQAEEALKVAKQAAEHSRKMAEDASLAKSDFLAAMSHEIRTPMSGVLGMTDLLLDSELTPKQRQQVETIRRSGRTLIRIINDILDFTKIQAGKMALQSRAFDLTEVVENISELFREQLEAKGIQFHMDMSDKINPLLQGDPDRLNQILYNLVGNAVKFTEKGGVSVSLSQVRDGEDDITLRFDITDTGTGISKAYRDKIFQAFSQEDGSVSRKYGGTGLGLVIARKLAILMGGELDFSSVEGKGSNFWFTANFGKQEYNDDYVPPPKPGDAPRTARRINFRARVLVVEDNPINQQVTRDTLEMMGCEVELAENGVQALEKLTDHHDRYHLVLMDCEMPELDGYEAARRWRIVEKEQGYLRLPVVALTAHVLDSFRDKALASGMDDFVSKPFSRDKLAGALRRWLPEDAQYPDQKVKELEERRKTTLDAKAIQQLQGMDIVRLVQLYLEQAPALLEQIFHAMEDGNHQAVRTRAHTLKSSSATMGAKRFAEMCRKVEEANRDHLNVDAVSLEELQSEFLLVCRALLEMVEET